MMKTFTFYYLPILAIAVTLLSACNKDDEDTEITSFVGSYVISSAELTEPLTLTTNEAGDYTLDPGTAITEMIQEALMETLDKY